MGIRIGRDDHGHDVSVNTGARSRVAILGPPASGKTTTCRFILRRWIAGLHGPCAVITARPYEYAHLPAVRVYDGYDGYDLSTTESGGLLVVDETHRLTQRILQWAVESPYQVVVVTSYGPSILELTTGPDPLINDAYSLGHSHPSLNLPVQGRLDWPPDTVPLFPDRRRRVDYPVHRWESGPAPDSVESPVPAIVPGAVRGSACGRFGKLSTARPIAIPGRGESVTMTPTHLRLVLRKGSRHVRTHLPRPDPEQ